MCTGPHGRFYSGQRVFVQDMQHRIQDVQGFRQDRLHVVSQHTAVAHANYDREPRCGQRASSAGLRVANCALPARRIQGRKNGTRPRAFTKPEPRGRAIHRGPLHWFSKDGGIATSPGTCLSGVGAPPSSMKSPYTGGPGLLCVGRSLALPRSAGGCYDLIPPGSIWAHPERQAVRCEAHTRRRRAGWDPCEFNRGCYRMVSLEEAGHQVRELTDFRVFLKSD
jgi:hypothetical protein